ncbi:prolyl hydroxylase family protein [Alteromonas gilva]|uniref:2OG-Fe(II) oxygenase n=1 Tax=Alteromonas gilva TaxID=2987522 RepID=A0ABT5KZ02_9ALTE|nr:2OG-Fe(II) oxygenase [Alteromonas gilva]MDC8829995.1 2OG-Fe(II) oxygenase [Alteromonas gilva]
MAFLTAKWKKWVLDSLITGQQPARIAGTMEDNGFAQTVIESVLGNNLPKNYRFRRPAERYHTLAQPRFLMPDSAVTYIPLCDTQALQLFAIDNFLSAAECDELVALSAEKLTPSTVAGAPSAAGIRTSTTCELSTFNAPIVSAVNARIVELLGLGAGEREVIQAQHYAPGQYYHAHYDFFPPGTSQYIEHCAQRGQRTWTCMIYLNDDFSGGRTTFTHLDISVTPEAGKALLWNNLHPDGTPNVQSMHVAEPVVEGNKVVITKWFRDRN